MDEESVSNAAPGEDQLLQEASLWFARMRSPDAASYQQAFDAWLVRGAAHRGAYNRAGEIFSMGKFLAEESGERDALAEPDVAPVPKRWPLALLLAGAAVIVLLSLWLAGAQPVRFGLDERRVIAGAKALPTARSIVLVADGMREQAFQLEDGSSVRLAPGSRLSIAFDADTRALFLNRGYGLFEVAHASRPFVVHAAGGSVTAHGTIFAVAIDDRRRVTVKLMQGAIDVATPNAQRSAQQLHAGQALRFQGADAPSREESFVASPMHAATAGGSAPLAECDDVQLSVLFAEANRYRGPPVRFADPSIGAMRLSGRFSVSDPAKLAERAATLLNLTVDRSDGSQIILRRG